MSGSNLYVANFNAGTIGQYTTSGSIVNASLISVQGPTQVVVSGSRLFVLDNTGTIGEYTLSGDVVNASLISGLSAYNFAVLGSNIFVAVHGGVSQYTTAGVLVNAALISGVQGGIRGIAVEEADAASAPEPSTIMLVGIGLGLASLCLNATTRQTVDLLSR